MKILLIVYDNESYIHTFPQGTAYLAAVLQKGGYDVTIYQQDEYHYSEEHLRQFLDKNIFDVVGLGVIGGYYQYQKCLKISNAINQSKNRPFFILGGHGPSPEPDFYLRKTKADVVVIGEGEETIIELLDSYDNTKGFGDIKGIAFKDSGKTIITPKRQLIKDIDSIAWPAYELFPISYYRLLRMPHCCNSDFVMPVLSGRGCTFTCNFCYRMDKGFRGRSSKSILEEIEFLRKQYGITYIAFSDELLMSSEERTMVFCEELLKSNIKLKWYCNGRLNYAKPDVLRMMKRSGCVFINYGIEAFDDEILKNMKKQLTTDQIVEGIEETLNVGISPGINIIFGNIGENIGTLRKGMELLLKYGDGAQMRTIRPVTPYPGSPLYYYAIESGLLRDCEDFYENKHVNSDLLSVNFTEMSDEEFHSALFEANSILIENYFKEKAISVRNGAKDLYFNFNLNFRGFRQT